MTGLGLAAEATTVVTGLAALALVLMVIAILVGRWPVWLLGLVLVMMAPAAAFLFRDPLRATRDAPDLILAPADGRVVAIDSVDDLSYVGGPAWRVSIRSGLLDVNVLRSPVDGVVDYSERTATGVRIGISTGRFRVLLSHGHRARVRVEEGRLVDPGERTGFSLTSSPVEILLPVQTRVRVRPGDRTRAGTTVLATVDGEG